MIFFNFIFLFITFFSKAQAAEIPFDEYQNYSFQCKHKLQNELGQIYENTTTHSFEFGGDAYFSASNVRLHSDVGEIKSHIFFGFHKREHTYSFYYANRSFDNTGVLIEEDEQNIYFKENQNFNLNFKSTKLNREFSAICKIIPKN